MQGSASFVLGWLLPIPCGRRNKSKTESLGYAMYMQNQYVYQGGKTMLNRAVEVQCYPLLVLVYSLDNSKGGCPALGGGCLWPRGKVNLLKALGGSEAALCCSYPFLHHSAELGGTHCGTMS